MKFSFEASVRSHLGSYNLDLILLNSGPRLIW